jgi:hypothetical protein
MSKIIIRYKLPALRQGYLDKEGLFSAFPIPLIEVYYVKFTTKTID